MTRCVNGLSHLSGWDEGVSSRISSSVSSPDSTPSASHAVFVVKAGRVDMADSGRRNRVRAEWVTSQVLVPIDCTCWRSQLVSRGAYRLLGQLIRRRCPRRIFGIAVAGYLSSVETLSGNDPRFEKWCNVIH